jgi:hypothetical protein
MRLSLRSSLIKCNPAVHFSLNSNIKTSKLGASRWENEKSFLMLPAVETFYEQNSNSKRNPNSKQIRVTGGERD